MDNPLPALRTSVGHLREMCRGLEDDQLDEPSYCSDWTIAGVLSHLGSGAVVMQSNVADALAGRTVPEGFAPSVWDVWNAKSSRSKADDALVADQGLLDLLAGPARGQPDPARRRGDRGPGAARGAVRMLALTMSDLDVACRLVQDLVADQTSLAPLEGAGRAR